MPEEKRKVGRPRKYDTQSARQKAYHKRKKQKMKDLEDQVRQLETQKYFSSDVATDAFKDIAFKDVPKFTWNKITPSEIALMGTRDLETIVGEFRERIQQYSTFNISLENITLGIINKNQLTLEDNPPEDRIEEINQQISENISNLEERMQQQTLLYLMEAELANRERLDGRKAKLDLFEAKIDELEKEVKEKEVKAKQRTH